MYVQHGRRGDSNCVVNGVLRRVVWHEIGFFCEYEHDHWCGSIILGRQPDSLIFSHFLFTTGSPLRCRFKNRTFKVPLITFFTFTNHHI